VVAAIDGGAGRVVAIGRTRGARLDAARALGATAIESDGADVVAAVREATGGAMADVIADLARRAVETVESAVQIARKGATIILASAKHGRPIAGFQSDIVVRRELTVKGVRGRDYESVEDALRIIASGRYPLEKIRTHEFGLGEVDRALRVQGERADPSAIHVTVVP